MVSTRSLAQVYSSYRAAPGPTRGPGATRRRPRRWGLLKSRTACAPPQPPCLLPTAQTVESSPPVASPKQQQSKDSPEERISILFPWERGGFGPTALLSASALAGGKSTGRCFESKPGDGLTDRRFYGQGSGHKGRGECPARWQRAVARQPAEPQQRPARGSAGVERVHTYRFTKSMRERR